MPRSLLRLRSILTLSVGLLAFAGIAFASTHADATPLVLPDASGGSVGDTATTILVSGEPSIVRLVVTLDGFAHERPDDVDVLLVGPLGQRVVLMSDAGGNNAVGILKPDGTDTGGGALSLVFDDVASDPLSDEGVISTGTYQPTNWGPSVVPACAAEPADTFPGAPAPPYASNLSVFNGTDPNGTWTLYVVDDCDGLTGSLQSGWALNINPSTDAVELARFSARAGVDRVMLGWRTANESQILGFNVFRSAAGGVVKLNKRLIRARWAGNARGASYRLVDARARSGASYTYRLQVVRSNGTRVWAGASALRAS